MKRFFYKWFIAALVVVASLTTFSCIAYKKTRNTAAGQSTVRENASEELLPWGGLSVKMPLITSN
jgi:hypothetical protein